MRSIPCNRLAIPLGSKCWHCVFLLCSVLFPFIQCRRCGSARQKPYKCLPIQTTNVEDFMWRTFSVWRTLHMPWMSIDFRFFPPESHTHEIWHWEGGGSSEPPGWVRGGGLGPDFNYLAKTSQPPFLEAKWLVYNAVDLDPPVKRLTLPGGGGVRKFLKSIFFKCFMVSVVKAFGKLSDLSTF